MRSLSKRSFVASIWTGSVAIALCVSSCGVSPTLPPLPPPTTPEISQVGSELVQLDGSLPVQRGLVFVLNVRTDDIEGQLVKEFDYSVQAAAREGDLLQLWYSRNGAESDFINIEVDALAESAE